MRDTKAREELIESLLYEGMPAQALNPPAITQQAPQEQIEYFEATPKSIPSVLEVAVKAVESILGKDINQEIRRKCVEFLVRNVKTQTSVTDQTDSYGEKISRMRMGITPRVKNELMKLAQQSN